jgi:hypothetical protein
VEGIVTVIELILVSLFFVVVLAVFKFSKKTSDHLMSPEWQRKRNAYRWERRAAIR